MKPQHWRAADGTRMTLRPMLKSDAPLLKESLGQLSRESRRNRFFSAAREVSDEMVHRLTHFDSATEFALVVVRKEKGKEIPLAGGRFVHESDGRRCEFSLLIGDAWQGQRIGHRILRVLIREAARRGLREMEGYVLADNQAMLRLARTPKWSSIFKVMLTKGSLSLVPVHCSSRPSSRRGAINTSAERYWLLMGESK